MSQGIADTVVVARLTTHSPRVLEEINLLTPQLKPSWDPITVEGLAAVLASPTRVYVARADDKIIGVVLLVPHHHLPGLRFHIEDVVVDEMYRRRGIARKLLTAAMDDAPADVISFDLRSHQLRDGAHELYLGLGFEPSGTTVFAGSPDGFHRPPVSSSRLPALPDHERRSSHSIRRARGARQRSHDTTPHGRRVVKQAEELVAGHNETFDVGQRDHHRRRARAGKEFRIAPPLAGAYELVRTSVADDGDRPGDEDDELVAPRTLTREDVPRR